MNSKAEKLLVVESDDALRERIVAVLRDAGYEVSTKQTGWNRSAVYLEKRAILPTAPVVNRPARSIPRPIGITVAMCVRGQGRGNRIGR